MDTAARVSGSRFAYLKGDLVMLEFALVRYALEIAREQGFEPVVPPVLVREAPLYGTGFLPDTEQQIYTLPDDDLYLVGTSEVPLASLHAGDILEEAALPVRYAGFSTCFRREAGAAGKDNPRGSSASTSSTRSSCSRSCGRRTRPMSTSGSGDRGAHHAGPGCALSRGQTSPPTTLGASAAKKYDLEAWLPGQERFRELTSCLEHHRLPGAPPRRPLPARGWRQARDRAHPQRHGRGGRPNDHRPARERPARRRLGGAARGPDDLRRAAGASHRRISLRATMATADLTHGALGRRLPGVH